MQNQQFVGAALHYTATWDGHKLVPFLKNYLNFKKFFTKTELLQLVTANVFSVLYYNSEIWHLPNLKTELKKKLISISARPIKVCMYYPDNMISFENLHKMNKRAMPETFMM